MMILNTVLPVMALAGLLAASSPTPARNLAIIFFRGTSTLHDFHGTAQSQPITFARTDTTWSAAARVSVTAIATAHAKRDKAMHEMFGASAFPSIHGVVTNAPIPVQGATNVVMQLRIRDRERPVTVKITDWHETPGGLQFHARATVSLKEFNLHPPSVLGLIRVGDAVELEADVTVEGGTP